MGKKRRSRRDEERGGLERPQVLHPYLGGYPLQLQERALSLLEGGELGEHLLRRYPLESCHEYRSDSQLWTYTQALKRRFMKSAPPLSKVSYDPKLRAAQRALGIHVNAARVQGGKLRAKREIKVDQLFRVAPLPFLNMIIAHELAHLREREHNRAFYQLCEHIESDYHQLEFDLRLYLLYREQRGDLYA